MPAYHIDAKGHFKAGSCSELPSTIIPNDKTIIDLVLKCLFDSGSGLDVIGLDALSNYLDYLFESPTPITVWTANGKTIAKYQVRIYIEALNEVVTPYVLKDSPNLLSIGKRAEKFGWGVQWLPWERGCHVTLPNGKLLFLHNEGFIPMVNSDKDNVRCGSLSETTAQVATEAHTEPVPNVNDTETTLVIEEVTDSEPATSSDEESPQQPTEKSTQGSMQSRPVKGKALQDAVNMPLHPSGVGSESQTHEKPCQAQATSDVLDSLTDGDELRNPGAEPTVEANELNDVFKEISVEIERQIAAVMHRWSISCRISSVY